MFLLFSTSFKIGFFLRLQQSVHIRICYTMHLGVRNLTSEMAGLKKNVSHIHQNSTNISRGNYWFVRVNTVLSKIKITSWALFYSPYIRWCGSPLSLLSFGYAWTDLSRGNTYCEWQEKLSPAGWISFSLFISLHFAYFLSDSF